MSIRHRWSRLVQMPRRVLHAITSQQQRVRMGRRLGPLLRLGQISLARIAALDRRLRLAIAGPSPDVVGRVLVSVTSYPARFGSLEVAIASVLTGRQRPEGIVVWLARDEVAPAALPQGLARLRRFGVQFMFEEDNFLPGNKLIHAIREYPDHTIVTIDDDVVYRRDRLEQLLACRSRNPESVLAFKARAVRFDIEGRLHADMTSHLPPGRYRAAFPEGVGMVLYPPKALAPEVLDGQKYRSLSLKTDDLWFGVHAFRHGTPITVCPGREPSDHVVPDSQNTSLWVENFASNVNDENLQALHRAYPELTAWPAALPDPP
jgi:hypothetical protein